MPPYAAYALPALEESIRVRASANKMSAATPGMVQNGLLLIRSQAQNEKHPAISPKGGHQIPKQGFHCEANSMTDAAMRPHSGSSTQSHCKTRSTSRRIAFSRAIWSSSSCCFLRANSCQRCGGLTPGPNPCSKWRISSSRNPHDCASCNTARR